MSTVQELLSLQEQLMYAVKRMLPNYKKLGQAKMTPAVTKQRLITLKDTFLRCQELDGKICLLADETLKTTHPYFKDESFITCEEQYYEAVDFMAEELAKHEPVEFNSTSHVSRLEDLIQPSVSHLPTIDLPTFDGRFDQWESFRDKFRSIIHDDPHLSDLKRLHYLSSCLIGDASNALDDVDLIEPNYTLAWNSLTSRYENKRKLITHRLQTLFNLPTITSETSKGLRDLRDQINKAIHSLKNLGRSVQHWDDILVFLAVQRLDKSTKKAWELKLGKSTDYPKYSELDEFLESRICGLEAITLPITKDLSKSPKSKPIASHSASTVNLSCPLCKASHLLHQCPTFLGQTPSQRFEFIKKCKRCINCFSARHFSVKNCTNSHDCKQCHQRHHTLLHFDTVIKPSDSKVPACPSNATVNENTVTSHLLSKSVAPKSNILLATARVQIQSSTGRRVTTRALLDQGSVSTFISESIAQNLRLPRIKCSARVTGIGETQSVVRHAADITINSAYHDGPAYSTTALILKTLTSYTPPRRDTMSRWKHLSGLELADREPMSNDPIDIIIGADLFSAIIMEGVRKGADNEPIAQQTAFGWILSGATSSGPMSTLTPMHIHHGTILESLDSHLRQFWEIEDIPSRSYVTAEEQRCDDHFLATHTRTDDGRYRVKLPFKSDPPLSLGESRLAAVSSLKRLEQRFQRTPTLASEYQAFMYEYERLGHMAKIPKTELTIDSAHGYYIPHHAVFRDNSATTRLRVVFNASCRTSNGASLNDHLQTGPKLQADLTTIIMQWRQYRYVYTADIAKMYRQILVDLRDTNYQRILWRESPSEEIQEYRLLTVTYGTTSAPYLALRVLKQLANDDGASFPLALPVLRHQIYVDDCVFGADDPSLARRTRDQLIALLNKGGFRLRKWASNCPALLSDIDPSDHGLACDKLLQTNEFLTVLGITWNPTLDVFQFRVSTFPNLQPTKRSILSIIAKCYDPLGWVAPVIVTAKIFMQQLWSLKCDWDDSLPKTVLDPWLSYQSNLPRLEELRIPRWTTYGSDTMHVALHGFSDASTKAYAAAVYLRSVTVDGSVTVSLLVAKTRVAPLKTISVPRLELSAAYLLAQLVKFVQAALQLPKVECHCWTDSTITLAWLKRSPSDWKTFVANRVAAIQTLLPDVKWRHVPTGDNPADCASRGLTPNQILKFPLWWSGPSWLILSPEKWPNASPTLILNTSLEERNPITICTAQITEKWDLASRFSSWPRLLRVTAYIIRFVNRARSTRRSRSHDHPFIHFMILSSDEIDAAKLYWLRTMQSELFPDELTSLAQNRQLKKSKSLSSFHPYLDSDGLLRVGGRLRHSHLPEATKHPILLRSHPLLSLLIIHHHLRTLHGGSQLTLASLRNEFWILRARATIRAVLYKCVQCTCERAEIPVELMGDLPDIRVNRSLRAFEHTGVDYAGPLSIRTAPGRGHKAHKAYIALFLCMTVKAVHIELVSDYTSSTFIAAYQRFISRRGLPSAMYSDNGTTFHGADREMTEAYSAAVRDPNFLNQLAGDKVTWHFLPPSAPHFGGLWEAGVRSIKHHLKRCIGNYTFTFEEMITFLYRVEACLNSRPIAPISDNIDDYRPLTPGHFLIGTPIIALPEPSLLDLNEARLSRWQLVQRSTEGFWKSWSSDYLHSLQQRPKWRIVQRLASVGRIVLLRSPTAPPSQWELGRVTACHPGEDGLTRVVTVKTSRSEYKRPLSKICFLPVDINLEDQNPPVTAGGDSP